MEEFERAQEEWDKVAEIVPKVQSEFEQNQLVDSRQSEDVYKETLLVTIEEVLRDFRRNYFESLLASEDETMPLRDSRTGRFMRLRHFLQCPSNFCNPPLQGVLEIEKNEVMAMSRCSFDDSNQLHFGVLLTIFKQLTRGRMDCHRYGSHWEEIGFQGNDPSTDLRGVGFLGLVQALYFVMTPELVPLARNIYRLSLHETQNFPLLVLSINVTRIALHALRDGLLNRQCIRENSVWSAVNYFYVSVMYFVYRIWKEQHKTIKDSGYVLKEAEQTSRSKIKQIQGELNRHIVSAYSVQEKQAERQNIQSRINKESPS